jgi:hypothetical protein
MVKPNTLEDIYRIFDAIQPDEYGCLSHPKAWPGLPVRVSVKGKRIYAHRVALERKLGRPINPGFLACHHCDWPSCVNPDHLYEGTRLDNAEDRFSRHPEDLDQLKQVARSGAKALNDKLQNDPEFRAQFAKSCSQGIKHSWEGDTDRREALSRRSRSQENLDHLSCIRKNAGNHPNSRKNLENRWRSKENEEHKQGSEP